MFEDYCIIFMFILFGILVGLGPTLLSRYFISPRDPYEEKLSAYECGFDPFSETRDPFDVRFYLISMIFILFDVELSFLFPWAVSFSSLPLSSTLGVFVFLMEFLIVYVYIYKRGALEWD